MASWSRGGNAVRLLLVEDELKHVRFIRRGLEEEQFAIDVATDGEEAMGLIEAASYDLVILDLMLPKRETIWPEVNPMAHVVPMANRPRQQEVTVPNAPGTIHSSTDAAGGNSGHDMRNLRVNGTPSSVLHRRGDGDLAPIPAG
jgi:CheY-like chemotaxis protein